MRSSRNSWRFLALFVGASALFYSSCDDGIGLLTTDEKQSLYRAEISSLGSSIFASYRTQGVILDPSKGIRILFETVKGSEEPVELAVTLANASGTAAESSLFLTGEAPSSAAKAILVPDLSSFSYTLAVPAAFPDGYYKLSMDARSAQSGTLFQTDIGLFLVRGSLPPPAILVYPANPSPGSRVLLVADLEGYDGRDPYLRWTVDGSVRAEGTVSEGKDKLFWPAPLAGSASAVSLSVYPVAPPSGVAYSFPAPRSASTSVLVAAMSAALPDEFGEPDRFLALFRMEESADYTGRGAGTGFFIGKPKLDVHAGGFGLTMGSGNSSGIQAESVLLPMRDGKLLPFSILVRLVPGKEASGLLFKAATESSGPSLEVALEDGRPSVIVRAQGRSAQVHADASLPGGVAGLLAVSVVPEASSLHILFHVDGKPCGAGILPLGASGWTSAGSTLIAGVAGCPGLYDEAGVWAYDSLGNPSIFPAFLFASRREYGAALRLVEGFEGTYGPEYVLSGGASVSVLEGLRLPPGGGAAFEAAIDAPFLADVVLSAGNRVVLSITGSEGTVKIPLAASDGRTDDYSGLPRLSVRAQCASGGSKAGIRLSSGTGPVVEVAGQGPWTVGLEGPDSGTAVVRYLRIRRSEGVEDD